MTNKKLSIRDGFGEGLYELCKNNKKVVVLTADLASSTRVDKIAKDFPSQFVECGVAEQNMMGVAAGLSLAGKIPFINSFAVFNPGRNWDQLRVSVCYSNLNVKIVGHHAGFSTSYDGATHQGLEDLAITRVLPNLTIIQPCDFYQAKNCVQAAFDHQGPVYIRIGKYDLEPIYKDGDEFKIGQADVLKEGDKLTLVSSGFLTKTCLEIAQEIDGVELINFSTIKPMDEKTLLESVEKTGKVVVVEDHQIIGGLGSAVAEVSSQKLPTSVLRLGMNDQFSQSGSVEGLLAKYNLNKKSIMQTISKII
jgi:transketolase